MTQQQRDRLLVLKKAQKERITQRQAATELDMTERHIRRLFKRVDVDQRSVSESAGSFGLSRPSFYQAQTALQQEGLFGLIPLKRGRNEPGAASRT